MLLFTRGAMEQLKQTEKRRKSIKYPGVLNTQAYGGGNLKEALIFLFSLIET